MAQEKTPGAKGKGKPRGRPKHNTPRGMPPGGAPPLPTAQPPGIAAQSPTAKAPPKKVTAAALQAYLDNVAATGLLTQGALTAGISPAAVRKRRADDPHFEAAVQQALETYRDTLRAEAHRRAVEGWVERPLLGPEGEIVGYVRKYSDRLLELKLKRHDPSYRENITVAAQVDANVQATAVPMQDLRNLDAAGRQALRTVLQQLGQGAKALGPGDAGGGAGGQ